MHNFKFGEALDSRLRGNDGSSGTEHPSIQKDTEQDVKRNMRRGQRPAVVHPGQFPCNIRKTGGKNRNDVPDRIDVRLADRQNCRWYSRLALLDVAAVARTGFFRHRFRRCATTAFFGFDRQIGQKPRNVVITTAPFATAQAERCRHVGQHGNDNHPGNPLSERIQHH